MQKAANEEVVPPSKITTVQIRPDHFKTLEAVCLKALSKDPRDRYSSAKFFAADLTRWLRGQDFRVANQKLRRRALGALAAVALLALAAFVAVRKPWLPSVESELARADALLQAAKADEALVAYTQILDRAKGDVRAETGRKAALDKLREKPAPPPAPVDPWSLAVDVLAPVRLETDVVGGKWIREEGALVSREGRPALLQLPYRPPSEYDVRIVFARQAANYCVNVILSREGKPFTLVMQREGYFGFEKLNGEDFNKNISARRFETPLQLNHPYTVMVRVRKDGVQSFCNDMPVSLLSSYDGLSMNPDWKLPDPSALGVGTWDGGAAIQKLEVREVSGRGEFVRPPAKK
jgi:hypothetical protein